MVKAKKERVPHLNIDELVEKKPSKEEKSSDISVGGLLQAARLKKKMEIEAVSEILRIKAVYLDALEKGHYYAFPARSYAIGFLRNYARYLKLNPDEIVELFHQETSNSKEEPLDMLVLEKKFPLPNFKTVCKILGILILVYIVWYLVAENLYSESPIIKEDLTIKTSATPEEVEVVPTETPNVEVVVEEKKEVPEVKEISQAVYSAPIAFVATDRVWVSIKDTENEKVLFDKVMSKHDHFIPKDTPLDELSVSTGRAGALDLYLDGEKEKTFGKEVDTPLDD